MARTAGIVKLVDFHKHHQLLGKLVADGKNLPIMELYQQYQLLLMEALKLKTTIRVNQHFVGRRNQGINGGS